MPDVTWTLGFADGSSAMSTGIIGSSERLTYRRAAAVDPTPTFAFASEADYQAVRERLLEATSATVATGRTRKNTAWYRERPPSSIDSFVVEVTPGDGITATVAFWGIIQGGSDASGASGTPKRLEVDLFVLADASEFEDHAAVESALGTEVV